MMNQRTPLVRLARSLGVVALTLGLALHALTFVGARSWPFVRYLPAAGIAVFVAFGLSLAVVLRNRAWHPLGPNVTGLSRRTLGAMWIWLAYTVALYLYTAHVLNEGGSPMPLSEDGYGLVDHGRVVTRLDELGYRAHRVHGYRSLSAVFVFLSGVALLPLAEGADRPPAPKGA